MQTPRPLPGFRLDGEDGNVFSIMGRFQRAARNADVPKEIAQAVLTDAKSGNYDHALQVFIPWEDHGKEED